MQSNKQLKLRGIVKCFYRARHFGFIIADGVEYFVTAGRVINSDAKDGQVLTKDQIVEFNVGYDERNRPQARRVRIISNSPNKKTQHNVNYYVRSARGAQRHIPDSDSHDDDDETETEEDSSSENDDVNSDTDHKEICATPLKPGSTVTIEDNFEIIAEGVTGCVKSFKQNKGFGFVHNEIYGNLFFHIKHCFAFDHCCKLQPGRYVKFDVAKSSVRKQAVDISSISPPSEHEFGKKNVKSTSEVRAHQRKKRNSSSKNSDVKLTDKEPTSVAQEARLVRPKAEVSQPKQSETSFGHLIHSNAFGGDAKFKSRKPKVTNDLEAEIEVEEADFAEAFDFGIRRRNDFSGGSDGAANLATSSDDKCTPKKTKKPERLQCANNDPLTQNVRQKEEKSSPICTLIASGIVARVATQELEGIIRCLDFGNVSYSEKDITSVTDKRKIVIGSKVKLDIQFEANDKRTGKNISLITEPTTQRIRSSVDYVKEKPTRPPDPLMPKSISFGNNEALSNAAKLNRSGSQGHSQDPSPDSVSDYMKNLDINAGPNRSHYEVPRQNEDSSSPYNRNTRHAGFVNHVRGIITTPPSIGKAGVIKTIQYGPVKFPARSYHDQTSLRHLIPGTRVTFDLMDEPHREKIAVNVTTVSKANNDQGCVVS